MTFANENREWLARSYLLSNANTICRSLPAIEAI